MQDRPGHRFVFATFTFDSASGELLRNGGRLRLPEQNARLLTTLLERAGSVVSRDELRRSMWPDGEFLDYDHSISNAVNQLRNILRDSSRTPAFIETLPKKGYRFIAQVQALSPPPESASGEQAAEEHKDEDAVPVDTPPDWNEAPQAVPVQTEPIRRGRNHALKRIVVWTLPLAAVVLLAAIGFLLYRQHQANAAPTFTYMGIAPFEASGPDAEPLAESFRLDLADSISQLPRIQVRADHSFSDTRQDVASIQNEARALQLDDLLFGKLSIDSQRNCVLQFELVRGRDAVHLGSFRYTGTIDQLVSIRDQVQRDIFARLKLAETGRRMPGSTENPRAYEDYLQARLSLLRPTDESVAKAVLNFQAAIAEDSGFARAWSGLATAYVFQAEHGAAQRDLVYRQAKTAAQKAVQLEPSQAEAHAMLGFIAFRQDWDATTSERELRQAVVLEPGQATHHLMLALLLGNTGRFHEAFDQIDVARVEDPRWPPVYVTDMYLFTCAHQYGKALDVTQKLFSLMPDWPLAYEQRGWIYWYSGKYEAAVNDWLKMAELEKDAARRRLEEQGLAALRKGGARAYAQLRVEAIRGGAQWAHPTDFLPAEWMLKAGDHEEALRSIREMIASHDPDSLQLGVSPGFEELRSDPEFLAMMRKAGIYVANRATADPDSASASELPPHAAAIAPQS